MSTLPEFLLARIAETEERARKFHPAESLNVHFGGDEAPTVLYTAARVLAECEAKRRIVEEVSYWLSVKPADVDAPATVEMMCRPLRHLASVYADHPDYREEWRL